MEFTFRLNLSAIRFVLYSVLSISSALSWASSSEETLVKENIKKTLPDYEIESINLHEKTGLYLIQLKNGPSLHATADGGYFLVGDLYRIEESGPVNESEEAKIQQVENLPIDKMVVFSAQEEKAHISVFTDITCGYCRMLHSEINELNDLGITVRYLAFPRAGIDSEPYNQMVSIWCADDPQKWMTNAKLGKKVPENDCQNPVADQYLLGKSVGVRGTPTLVLSSGKLIPGYVPAAKLAQELGL